MKCVKTGELNPNALELEQEVQPVEDVRAKSSLNRLNYMLGFIKENKQEILSNYIAKLLSEYHQLLTGDIIGGKEVLPKFLGEMPYLAKHPELAKNAMNYYLQVLQLPKDIDWMKDNVKVKQGTYLRSFLLQGYYQLLALTKTIDREEAIKLYKRYVTHYIMERERPEGHEFAGIEAIFEKRSKPDLDPSEWVMLHGLLPNGKYFYRNDNCLWVEALEDLPDNELKYYVCCYGDYQGAKFFYDESIILTMEHTIAQGDPYCSRVLHDTRTDWDLRHPPKEWWDNLEY